MKMLTGFFMCGVSKTGKYSGDEYSTLCPFCSRENKFYISIVKGVWQCKVCGEQGNYLQFLEKVSKHNAEYITEDNFEELALNRKLPRWIFEGNGIGFDGKQYSFPYYNYEGNFHSLQLYRLGGKPMGVANCALGLYGLQELSEKKEDDVYLCEGTGDVYAMRYLLKILEKPGVVLGLPGAQIFKDEWIDYFYHRNVICLLDNDDAGMQGELKIHEKLSHVADEIKYIHWPLNAQKFPNKYDVRDYVTSLAVKLKKPKTCYRRLHSWLESVPREALVISETNEEGKLVLRDTEFKNSKPATFEDVVNAYKRFLHVPDITPIKVMLAVIFANRLRSEPVWMFFVAPPSSAKTEFISALKMCPETRHISTLTEKTLVSGWNQIPGKDPSLIPQLNNKILVIKDFTPILTSPPITRDVIYSQLRDIYDGSLEKPYGHSIVRSYKNIHFGVLAAVTGSIERTAMMQQTLGERFLRYNLPLDKEDLSEKSEISIMKKSHRAFDNVSHEQDQRYVAQTNLRNYLQYHKPASVTVADHFTKRLIYLSRFTAALRGVVDRDFKERMMYKPMKEGHTRVLKQLKLMVIGLASVEGRKEITEEDYRIVKQIAISSTPSRIETIINLLYRNKGPLKNREIMDKTKFDYKSAYPITRDLILLDLIIETKVGGSIYFELSELCRFYIDKSQVYG